MVERLVDGVWLLEVGSVVPIAGNAYLVDDGEVTLVDAGLPRTIPSLRAELSAVGYDVEEIDRILLTHYDIDHTGGLARIRTAGAPVFLGERDAALLAGERLPSWFHPKAAFHRVARRVFPIPGSFDVSRVRDGQPIGSFVAYHTPGHNPGHTVYVHEDGLAFLGDLVWSTEGRLVTPFWLDSYDMHQLRESVRDLADRITFEVACPGHGRPVFDPDALRVLAGRLSQSEQAPGARD